MQLDRSDALYETKLWLLERLGLAVKPIKWEKLDMAAAAVAARVLCLRQVELQQLQCIENLQQPLNPRNEAAALAILVANQTVVCGSSSQRRQELQQLTAGYPVSLQQQQQHGHASAARPLSKAATEKLCDSNNNIPPQQQQQQQQNQVSTQGPASVGASVKVCESFSNTSQQQSQQQQQQHAQASAEGPLSVRATEKLPDSDNSIPQQQQQALAAAGTDTGESIAAAADEQPCSSNSSSCLPPLQQQQQQHKPVVSVPYEAGSPEQQLLSWVLSQGASSQVIPAHFPTVSSSSSSAGKDKSTTADPSDLFQQQQQPTAKDDVSTIRGCATTSDLPAGINVISLPVSLLITYKTAAESDFGRVLTKIGLDSETLVVVWTMVERWDEESAARPFWQALPEQFNTGLGVPEPLIDLLKGTPLHTEIVSARQHIRQQYQDLQQAFKVLLAAYPSYLQEKFFSLANYLWAVELWYAYAIQVKFPDGTIQSALAPFVSLLNHSPWPQIVHFSTVDPETRQLNLTNFRPLQQHDQVFLSYGPLPNARLLLFYGFTVQGNPFEELQITLDLPQDQQQQQGSPSSAATAAEGDLADVGERMKLLQDLGLGLQYRLTVQQPVPPGLRAALRVLHCSRKELQAVQAAVQLAVQQRVTTGYTAVAVAAAAGNSGSSSVKSASNNGQGSNPKASRKSKKANDGKLGVDQKVSSGSGVGNELERKWAAAAVCQKVLGPPLSETTEAAVKQRLSSILKRLRAPYEACVGKIARRRQLQAMLVQQQQAKGQQGAVKGSGSEGEVSSSGNRSSPTEEGFLACVEVYARDLISLCNACGRGSAVW